MLETFSGTESDVIYPRVREFLAGFIAEKEGHEQQ